MHGRLRVKTTEQQEAEKAVEREKKLAKYNAGTQLLFKKRRDGVYDEETALQLSQILSVNPDFYTLWNYRREIFLRWKAEKSAEYLQSMLKSDLHFTEQCLGVNPKSYCAWHHRCWVMENMPTPDWAAEVELCDKYLKMDGRNFHCWDYRRFAVAGAGRQPESELAAADLLIRTNFSNYSSWHYRSHLLTQLYPAGDAAAPIREDKYLQELELVQSAAFTDPDDQAAWFYHRWLLQARRPAADIVSCTSSRRGHSTRVVVALAKAARPLDIGLTLLDGDESITQWTSPADEDVDTVWVADTKVDAAQLSVQITSLSGSVERALCDTKTTGVFASDLSAATGEVLKQELENVRQLGEMEPDNKWVLLSSVVLMWALDPRSHEEKILTAIDDLMKLDHLRQGYYKDLRSRFVTERRIASCGGAELSLADCRLTTLPHTSRLTAVTALDVSRNRLRSADLSHLVAASRVTAVDNRLVRLRLPADRCCSVAHLLLDNNDIRRVSDLGPGVTHSVREISLAGNPVCDSTDFRAQLLERFPRLEVVNGQRV